MITDIINWGELSRMLTGSRQNIRKNRIPGKYRDKVEKLLRAIDKWKGEIKVG